MTTKYHINQKTGKASECNATVKTCPVGGKHYPTEVAATKAYEAANHKNVAQAPMKKTRKKNTPVEVDGVLPGMEIPGEDLVATQERLARPRVEETHGVATVDGISFEDIEPRERETLDRIIDSGRWNDFRQSAEADTEALADLDEYLNDWETSDRVEEVALMEADLEKNPGAAGSNDLRWKINLILDAQSIAVSEKLRSRKSRAKKTS